MLVLFDAIAIWYVMAYAAKVRSHPERSLTAGSSHKFVRPAGGDVPILTFRRKVVLALFAAVFHDAARQKQPAQLREPPAQRGDGDPDLVEGDHRVGHDEEHGGEEGQHHLPAEGKDGDTVLYWGEQALEGAGSVSFILLVYLIYRTHRS